MPRGIPLITFSHLRWDFVLQRPQQIMSRMAANRDVWFVEEPISGRGQAQIAVEEVAPGLRVCRPEVPEGGPAFGVEQTGSLERSLRQLLDREPIREFATWLYTPAAVRVALALQPRAIFYDCMEDVSAIADASRGLIDDERELMAHADVIFTSGLGLYRARREQHSFVRCFLSSADFDHFEHARTIPEAADQADLPRPRLGFYGVLDDRLDVDALAALAAAHPEWQIVLIGPVVKIDPATLPEAPNIHYLGQRLYERLPEYIAGWDACLMPYVLGPATRFISPTKALECMASDRPVVTTPLTDVVEPFGEIVFSGAGPAGFVAACEQAMTADEDELSLRRHRALSVLHNTSWDDTVRRMDEIIRFLLDEPRRARPAITTTSLESRP